MARSLLQLEWLRQLGRPEPRDDSTTNWESRLDRSVRQRRRGRLRDRYDDELAEGTVPEIWAGLDIGKKHHHGVVIDADGKRLLSRRVMNDETELLQLLGGVLKISGDVLWPVDINTGIAALATGLEPLSECGSAEGPAARGRCGVAMAGSGCDV
jgi:hypothetical protein